MKNSYSVIFEGFRIFSALWIAFAFRNFNPQFFLNYPKELWAPIGILQWFTPDQITATMVNCAWIGFWVFLFFVLIGFFTRLSCLCAALLLMLLTTYLLSFGYVPRVFAYYVLTLFIFSAFPLGRRWSIDALLFKNRPQQTENDVDFFLFSLRALLCVMYFSAAISKLKVGIWDWISNATLVYALRINDISMPTEWFHSLLNHPGVALSYYPLLCSLLAGAAFLLELSSPLVLFFNRLRPFILPSLFIMQLAMWVLLKANFIYCLLILFIAWLPLKKWTQRFDG